MLANYNALIYKPPFFLFNAHLETIYPALFRKVTLPSYSRERIITADDDFLDLDWLKQGSSKLVIISHGLEGNSSRAYMKGMAKVFSTNGYDVLAWNFRGCSEEMNKQLRFYHSGATEDLDWLVKHAIQAGYQSIYLIGFSLGGNLTLKYLGEKPPHAQIKKAVVFSVPMHLHSSCLKISQRSNAVYANRFLKSLKAKIITKSSSKTDLDTKNIHTIKTLVEFDDFYTAPLHSFKNALDYYDKNSSLYFLDTISLPTLIVNASNDPFLSEECFPKDIMRHHPFVTFETPSHGGHVGFAQFNKNGLYWSEERALRFIELNENKK